MAKEIKISVVVILKETNTITEIKEVDFNSYVLKETEELYEMLASPENKVGDFFV